MFTNNQWCQKCVVFAFVISQQIKEIIANRHEKLNRLEICLVCSMIEKKTILGVHVSLGSAETLVMKRCNNKSPFASILSQQHL